MKNKDADITARAIESIHHRGKRAARRTGSAVATGIAVVVPMTVLAVSLACAMLALPAGAQIGGTDEAAGQIQQASNCDTGQIQQASNWDTGQIQQASDEDSNPICQNSVCEDGESYDDEADASSPLDGVEELLQGFVTWFNDVFNGGSEGSV